MISSLNVRCFYFPNPYSLHLTHNSQTGGLAQMVERSLRMREVTGSMPVSSKVLGHTPFFQPILNKMASTKFTRCFFLELCLVALIRFDFGRF